MNFQYHILLLLHFEYGNILNNPHYLCRSLRKMARQNQKHPKNTFSSLHHCGLLKIFIKRELHNRNDDWDNFVNQNVFDFFHVTIVDYREVSYPHQIPQIYKNIYHPPMQT